MLGLLEKSCTSTSYACLPGLVVSGWDLMFVESSWVSVVIVKCLSNDNKPVFG
jgi:hypothetical protein